MLDICLDRDQQTLLGTDWTPVSPVEWVYDEMRVRVWCAYVTLDVIFSYPIGREPLHDYFRHRFRLPAHEFFFESVSAEVAYDSLYSRDGRSKDIEPFDFLRLTGTRDPVERHCDGCSCGSWYSRF